MEFKEKIEIRRVRNGFVINHKSGEVVAYSRKEVVDQLAEAIDAVIPNGMNDSIRLEFTLLK